MTNNKQQTAVEWLIKQLQSNINIRWRGTNIIELGEQAKEMEKEQIEDAYWEGGIDVPTNGERCQQYFNETYGDDKQ